MNTLLDSFLRSLASLPLLLAALYMLSIVSVTSAGQVAASLLKARVVFTLLMSAVFVGDIYFH